jgi:aminoglycoside phosphotransferase (APT) family kinase protein
MTAEGTYGEVGVGVTFADSARHTGLYGASVRRRALGVERGVTSSTVVPDSRSPTCPPPWSAAREAWLTTAVGDRTRIVATTRIGVSSTTMDAVDVADPRGRVHRLALRRFTDSDRLTTDPWYDPSNEAAALELLEGSGVPAPRLIAADLAGEVWDDPTLLTSYIPGRTVASPSDMRRYLSQLASTLVRIHAVPVRSRSSLLAYAPYAPAALINTPEWTSRPGLWERVLGIIAAPPPSAQPGFIHRDYHQDQALFVRGRLSGVVDWTTACIGPRDIDLARMRLNLAWSHGARVADRFRSAYQAEAGGDGPHPYWELVDCADLLPDMTSPASEEESRELRRFERHVASIAAAFR